MINQEPKKDLFLTQMKSMRPQQLTNLLRCIICHGLYRFAHTVVDCGHTFCQFCIFTYIKGFKGRNPSIRCPQCNGQINSNYNKSIMRDVFKQNLVDILEPSYVLQQEKIIKRVKQIFPQQDLQFLLDQFKFSQYDFPSKRKKNQEKNIIMGKLVNEIKVKLNISFETFVEQISKDDKYNEFKQMIRKKQKKEKLLQIRPRGQREDKYVGINHKLKAQGLSVTKLIRFIQKKALQKIKNYPQQVLRQFLNEQKTRIDIKIRLQCQKFNISSTQADLTECNQPIYYILL